MHWTWRHRIKIYDQIFFELLWQTVMQPVLCLQVAMTFLWFLVDSAINRCLSTRLKSLTQRRKNGSHYQFVCLPIWLLLFAYCSFHDESWIYCNSNNTDIIRFYIITLAELFDNIEQMKNYASLLLLSLLTNYCPSVLDTVDWVIWPVKIVPDMTYNVFGGMLNPTLPLSSLVFI